MLASGGHDPVAHLAAGGVVLQPGEIAWIHTRARLAVWTIQSAWVTCSRVRWRGRRAESTSREVAAGGWRDHGAVDWLITSLRLVGRTGPNGGLLSIWWSDLAGVKVDLGNDTIYLEAANGWRGQITGPGIAPIGVAAIAVCHGQRPTSQD
jgi:hypothetical protein